MLLPRADQDHLGHLQVERHLRPELLLGTYPKDSHWQLLPGNLHWSACSTGRLDRRACE